MRLGQVRTQAEVLSPPRLTHPHFFFGWTGFLLAQALPALIAGALGSYLFYDQHNFPEVAFHDRAGWT